MKFGWIAAAMLLGGGLCLAQSEAPSLGDIARKNQAANKQQKKGRVLTEDDFSSAAPGRSRPAPTGAPSAAAVPAADSRPEAAQTPPGTEPASTDDKKDKNKRAAPPAANSVEQLKKELDSLKVQQKGWSQSADRYQEKLAAETSEFRRAMYQDALNNDRQNVALCQRKIEDTESRLAAAQDAASRSTAAPPP